MDEEGIHLHVAECFLYECFDSLSLNKDQRKPKRNICYLFLWAKLKS